MKKITSYIIFFIILSNIFFSIASAVDCHPAYDGNWGVTENCNWPDGYKVYGDIYVGDYTITMGSNDDMGIDLSNKKITFDNGKINLDSSAKIANHVTTRYYIGISYDTDGTGTDCDDDNDGNQCTACPSGMYAFDLENGNTPEQDGSSHYLNNTSEDNPGPYDDDDQDDSDKNVMKLPDSGTFYCGTKGVANQ